MNLTTEQTEILKHTSRNEVFCGDSTDMQVLVSLGLMKSRGKVSWCPDEYFGLTSAGREAMRVKAEDEFLVTVTYGGETINARCETETQARFLVSLLREPPDPACLERIVMHRIRGQVIAGDPLFSWVSGGGMF